MPVILVYSSSRSNWACGRRLPSSQKSKKLIRLKTGVPRIRSRGKLGGLRELKIN